MSNDEFKQAFINGQEYWRQCDYVNARNCFETSIKDPHFKDKSLMRLAQIEIKEGDYFTARQMLDENKDSNVIGLKLVSGLLDNIEYNFESSKKYYGECLQEPNLQYKMLLSIARLYIQTGDNLIARKMLETLQLKDNYNIQATISLAILEVLEENYDNAYKLIETLNNETIEGFTVIKAFIKSKLGVLNKPKYPLNPTENYTLYRLYDNSDKVLLDHVERHLNQDTKQTTGCFFKYTDLKMLLRDVRDKLEVINPSHFGITDVYRFHLDDEIGFKKDKVTRDICVVTMLGTKDIITMYPQTLSDKFDIEKASTSKELARKRIERGMKI